MKSLWISLLTIVRPDETADPARRRAHRAWLYGWLALMGLGVGLLSLMLSACAAPSIPHRALFWSYFRLPWLLVLNLFPPIALVFLGFFLFRRPWAALLTSAVPTLLLSLGNYYKIQLRGDPVLATDLKLLRTAGGIVGHYTLELTSPVLLLLGSFAAMLLFSIFLMRSEPLRGRIRPLGVLLSLTLLLGAYFAFCSDAAIYDKKTDNSAIFITWSDLELSLSKGTVYPFLYSVQQLFPSSPDGYAEQDAAALLTQYEDADLPADEKVTVVGVMLEAFCDLTDFPVLAEIPAVQEVYAPLHELEEKYLSGDLLTNIFAGGTTDTEWGFLTGYSTHEDFLAPTNSYVWYFKQQGYDTLYRHPGYNWFYDRVNVNNYLGFDESVFQENGFADLITMNDALYYSDAVLYDYLLADLDARTPDDAPLFLFSVTYQNHGPYPTHTYWEEYVTVEDTGWSYETCCILNNYLVGIERTIRELCRFVDELEARDTPIVLVFFGDHKPWLGNGNSVYTELGISLDTASAEGFRNYFSTPYAICANSAAQNALDGDFTGDGGDFSPCYLMQRLFDACAWQGPAFLQLQRAVHDTLPMMNSWGYFWQDGAPTGVLSDEDMTLYQQYRYVEYYREQHFAPDGALPQEEELP